MRPPPKIDHKRKLGPNSEDLVAHMDAEIKRLRSGLTVAELEEKLAACQLELSELRQNSEEQHRNLRWEADMANYARDQIFRQYKEEKEKAANFDLECKGWVKKHTRAKDEAQWYKDKLQEEKDKQTFEANQRVRELEEQMGRMALVHGKEKLQWEKEKKHIMKQGNKNKRGKFALKASRDRVLVNYQKTKETLRNLILVAAETSDERRRLREEKEKLSNELSEEAEKAYEWYQQALNLEEHLTACQEDLSRKVDDIEKLEKEVQKFKEVFIKTCARSDRYELAYEEEKEQAEMLLKQVGEIIVVVKGVGTRAETILRHITPIGSHGQETVTLLEQIITRCNQIRNFYKHFLTAM